MHLGLYPMPFVGNLECAKVVVLLLNPGLAPTDYFGEYEVPGYRDRLVANLNQRGFDRPYPFFFLDPSLAWHSGYDWWHSKLHGVISELSRRWVVTYALARARVASEIAALELIPYHSEVFTLPISLRDRLQSVQVARAYTQDVLVPKAARGDVTLVVTRHVRTWGVKPGSNVVIYEGTETRGARISPGSRGGDQIIAALS